MLNLLLQAEQLEQTKINEESLLKQFADDFAIEYQKRSAMKEQKIKDATYETYKAHNLITNGKDHIRLTVLNHETFGYDLDFSVITDNMNLESELLAVNNVDQYAPDEYAEILDKYKHGIDYIFGDDSFDLFLIACNHKNLRTAFYSKMS